METADIGKIEITRIYKMVKQLEGKQEEWAEALEMRKHSIERECVEIRPELLDNASVDDSTATIREVVRTWMRAIIGEDR